MSANSRRWGSLQSVVNPRSSAIIALIVRQSFNKQVRNPVEGRNQDREVPTPKDCPTDTVITYSESKNYRNEGNNHREYVPG